jgi:hypothetical protein
LNHTSAKTRQRPVGQELERALDVVGIDVRNDQKLETAIVRGQGQASMRS